MLPRIEIELSEPCAHSAVSRVTSERLVAVSDAPLALVKEPPATLPPV